MTTVDNTAIIWSVVIVIIAVGFTTLGNTAEQIESKIVTPTPFNVKLDVVEPSISSQITVKTGKETYLKNDKIKVSGLVDPVLPEIQVTMVVISPEGNLIAIAQTELDDNKQFSETILTSGVLWTSEGEYSIEIIYGKTNTAQITFEFIMPVVSDLVVEKVEIENYDLHYDITSGMVHDITLDDNCNCMNIIIDAQDNDGVLALYLPRGLIDAKMSNGEDDMFFVLMDGVEIAYQEIDSTDSNRTIVIKFEQGTSDIEVIGIDPNWR